MSNKLILHVPHASTQIPLMDGFIVDADHLEKEILKLTDWYTHDLFHSSHDEMIVAEFSRIFCDPERFTDDAQEVMAQYGMGVLYEKNDAGERIRTITPELREHILSTYYWKHHQRFSEAVSQQLTQHGKALILDCHSYPSKPLKRDLNQNPERPDFNIGTDPYHTPQALIDISVSFFEQAGYSLGIDWPYKGAIVPLEYYQKNKHVSSIMLEINRALYLQEPSNEKSATFTKTKQVVQEYIQTIKQFL